MGEKIEGEKGKGKRSAALEERPGGLEVKGGRKVLRIELLVTTKLYEGRLL